MDRAKTGIEKLDSILNGGLPTRGVYVVAGDCGTGKSIMSMEYIYRGAKQFNEPGVYVSLEENREELLLNTQAFGWDLDSLEKKGLVRIIPYIHSLAADVEVGFEKGTTDETMGKAEFFSVNSLYEMIREAVAEIKAKRVVVDPWTAATLMSATEARARLSTLFFFQKLQGLGVTSIVTVEKETAYWRQIFFLANGALELDYVRSDSAAYRGFFVRKMRASSFDEGFFNFKIGKQGIEVME